MSEQDARTDIAWMSESTIREYAYDLLALNGLDTWRVDLVSSLGSLVGYCDSHEKRILLNRAILQDTRVENIRETVLHEIAHALVGYGHGKAFSARLAEIGGTGTWKSPDRSEETR